MHGHALKVRKAAWFEDGFTRDHDNHMVLKWKETGNFLTVIEAQLANYLGAICDVSACAVARGAQVAVQVQALSERLPPPAPAPRRTVHCLCDGKPVTIEPEGFYHDNGIHVAVYTIDETGEMHWGDWKSHRFAPLPQRK